MARFRCLACRGEFEDQNSAGVAYFHACAPVPNPTYQPDPSKPAYDPAETRERANKRDENIHPEIVFHDGRYWRRVPQPGTDAGFKDVPVPDVAISPGPGRLPI